MVGGLVTRHLSVRNPVSRWLMLALDPLLLLAASLAVAWAFGLRTALLLVVFVGTHYLLSWGHLKGALLRTDFAMASVLAVCLVKQRYYKIVRWGRNVYVQRHGQVECSSRKDSLLPRPACPVGAGTVGGRQRTSISRYPDVAHPVSRIRRINPDTP